MSRLFNKILIAVLALFFGISEEVAAQYGIVTNHYKLKGEVGVQNCPLEIPGIRIVLSNKINGQKLDTAVTDSSGKYEMNFISREFPKQLDSLMLEAKDIDGEKNLGKFKTFTCPVTFSSDKLKQTAKEGWDSYYEYGSAFRFMMKPEDKPPCGK
jgi:putative lipoprotein (rSAM/lipoprotein system)